MLFRLPCTGASLFEIQSSVSVAHHHKTLWYHRILWETSQNGQMKLNTMRDEAKDIRDEEMLDSK